MRQATLGKSQYHAAMSQAREAHEQRLGRPHQLHLQPPEGQPVRRGQLLLASTRRRGAGRLQPRRRSTRSACSTCRTRSPFSPIIELPFGEGKRWAHERRRRRDSRRLDASRRSSAIESGFPIVVCTPTPTTPSIFTRDAAREPGTGDAETDGTRYERIAPPTGSACTSNDCGTGLWLNAAGFTTPAPFTLGTMPRTLDDVRTPHRNNWDFVASQGHPPGRQRCAARSASKC